MSLRPRSTDSRADTGRHSCMGRRCSGRASSVAPAAEWQTSFNAMVAKAANLAGSMRRRVPCGHTAKSGGCVNAPDETARKEEGAYQADNQRTIVQDDYRALMRHLAGAVTVVTAGRPE